VMNSIQCKKVDNRSTPDKLVRNPGSESESQLKERSSVRHDGVHELFVFHDVRLTSMALLKYLGASQWKR
jgi:hypothetical protein